MMNDTDVTVIVEGKSRNVPVAELRSITPGLLRRPELLNRIEGLVADLGASRFRTRTAAFRELKRMGPRVRSFLQQYRDDDDAERRARIGLLLEHFQNRPGPTQTVRSDLIDTTDGAVEGRLAGDSIVLLEGESKRRRRLALSDIVEIRRADLVGTIDLLRAIGDSPRAVRGTWTIEEGKLLAPGNRPWALLQLPLKPPPSYTLRARVERKSGTDALVFPIIVGGRECNVCIDGWPRGKVVHSGLELIRRRGPATNKTGRRGRILHTGKPVDIEITVGPRRVRLVCDEKTIFAWEGNPMVLSMQKGWTRPDTSVLSVGCYSSSFEITRLELLPRDNDDGDVSLKKQEFDLRLVGGVRLAVTAPPGGSFDVSTPDGAITCAVSEIRTLTTKRGVPHVRLFLADGQFTCGRVMTRRIIFEREHGEIVIPVEDIVSLTAK